MGKRIRDYVKYTLSELETYTKIEGSCVKKVNNKIHLNLPPYALADIKKAVSQVITAKKIGFYDLQMQGIVLDVRNIKILGDIAPISFGNPNIHINIEADCYIFQPTAGAIVRGIVKHVSSRQIGVIIYRVFSVFIRLDNYLDKNLEFNSEIEFRIKKFELQNVMPFIEGELVAKETSGKKSLNFAETQKVRRNSLEIYNKVLVKEPVVSDESSDSDLEITQITNHGEESFLNTSLKENKYSQKSNRTEIASKTIKNSPKIKEERSLSQLSYNIDDKRNLQYVKKEYNSNISEHNSSDNENEDIFASQYSSKPVNKKEISHTIVKEDISSDEDIKKNISFTKLTDTDNQETTSSKKRKSSYISPKVKDILMETIIIPKEEKNMRLSQCVDLTNETIAFEGNSSQSKRKLKKERRFSNKNQSENETTYVISDDDTLKMGNPSKRKKLNDFASQLNDLVRPASSNKIKKTSDLQKTENKTTHLAIIDQLVIDSDSNQSKTKDKKKKKKSSKLSETIAIYENEESLGKKSKGSKRKTL